MLSAALQLVEAAIMCVELSSADGTPRKGHVAGLDLTSPVVAAYLLTTLQWLCASADHPALQMASYSARVHPWAVRGIL